MYVLYSEGSHSRELSGLHNCWLKVKSWLTFRGPLSKPEPEEPCKVKIKCPEIEVLDHYDKDPGEKFWSKFPKREFPSKVHTDINIENLAKLLQERSPLLTTAERLRGARTLDFLTNGASAHQKSPLPCVTVKNAKTAVKHGRYMTDNVASWVKSGFVAGPFDTPPCSKLRVNAMVAVEQNEKVRPCMNVSLPEGASFNDNVKLCDVEKVHMSSARQFGYALREAGKDATISKFDMKDAYKNIPAKLEELRLQGFIWLGKFFVELKQTFGALTSVSNFDVLGNTVQTLARAASKLPKNWCQRQLDDNPVVAPARTKWCESYSEDYEDICKNINIKLADECPKRDKAFKNVKEGKVLGIWFDSKTMEWRLPCEKADKAKRAIYDIFQAEKASLHDVQSLVGRLNDIGLMCPFLTSFRRNISSLLSNAEERGLEEIVITELAKDDLLVWWAAIEDCEKGLPIPCAPSGPNIYFKKFAIVSATRPANKDDTFLATGVGCFGTNEDGFYLSSCSYLWDKPIFKSESKCGASRPANFIGITLCILANLEYLKHQHVVFTCENITNCWDWEKQYSKGDDVSNILIRCISILSAYLGSKFHIEYKSEMRDWEGLSATGLARRNRKVSSEKDCREELKKMKIERCFSEWLRNPCCDWNLPKKLATCLE
jgi:hypothetical protein